jgi:hypothetical protein
MLINVNDFKSNIAILPGSFCYIGASSTPKRAIIVATDGVTVTYCTYPYYELRTEQIKFFRIDATLGTTNRVKHLQERANAAKQGDRFAFYSEALDNERLYLIELLQGFVYGDPIDYKQEQAVKVYVEPIDQTLADHWSLIEEQGFSVIGQALDNGYYEVSMPRNMVSDIQSLPGYVVRDVKDWKD